MHEREGQQTVSANIEHAPLTHTRVIGTYFFCSISFADLFVKEYAYLKICSSFNVRSLRRHKITAFLRHVQIKSQNNFI